jgi:hypothetical protein
MNLAALHDLIRSQVQDGAAARRNAQAFRAMSRVEQAAFRTMRRRFRRARTQGRGLVPPSGSVIWG